MASLSPLFRMCSGGRIRLFISSRYWWEQGAGGERNKGRQGERTKKTSEWERKWIKSISAYPWIKFNTHIQPTTKHDTVTLLQFNAPSVNTKLFDWDQHTSCSNIILRRGLLLACVCCVFTALDPHLWPGITLHAHLFIFSPSYNITQGTTFYMDLVHLF